MLKNYLKITLRNFRKHKGLTFINVFGLALGLACCIVIMLFVRDEVSYDQYHQQREQIYRLAMEVKLLANGKGGPSATTPILWAPAMRRDFPEVINYARFVTTSDPKNPVEISFADKKFNESNLLFADAAALEIFSWPLLQGDPKTALTEPNAIVISAAMAAKYFGSDNPLGKTLSIDPKQRDDSGKPTRVTQGAVVTGVVADIPHNSHFTFDFLLPIVKLNKIFGGDVTTGASINAWFWRGRTAHTYVLLQKNADPAALAAKMPAFIDKYVGDALKSRGYAYVPFLQPLTAIHLGGNFDGELQPGREKQSLYIFALVAFFILLIACINFMNLATARSLNRAREVGMRKVVGANRSQLIKQFLGESVILTFVALLLAIGLAEWLTPKFYSYVNKAPVADSPYNWLVVAGLAGIGLLVGVLSGSYPAFFLSAFTPGKVLKGALTGAPQGAGVRKGLVVFQFAISAFLIIATLTVFNQLQFMHSKGLGFAKEHVVVIPPNIGRALQPQLDAFKAALLQNPHVVAVTASAGVPGSELGGDIYAVKGAPAAEGRGIAEFLVDYHFIEMFDLELIAGRNFSKAMSSDAGGRDADGRWREVAVVVNEEAVRSFGFGSPAAALGKQIVRDPRAIDFTATIIGVVKDFHFQSLREQIRPAVLAMIPDYAHVSVKIRPEDIPATVAFIKSTGQNFAPEIPFAYSFLDADFNALYQSEEKLTEVFVYVAFLAIFVAGLGLFGLASFTAEQRTKEIGVRKVLGASLPNIVTLLSKDFIKLVFIASLIAMPAGYWVMNRWLENFAYRTTIGFGTFALTGVLALTIAWLTISLQSLKAALANPVEALRYE